MPKHLENDDQMKRYFGPQSGIGDQHIYLASSPVVKIQGEGPHIGKNSLFLEFFGCNQYYTCGKEWCDSPHTFYNDHELEKGLYTKPSRFTYRDINQLFDINFTNNMAEFNNVVITGGEPLLWQLSIAHLLRLIRDSYYRDVTIEIETNGTIPIDTELVDWFRMVHFNICPKIEYMKRFALVTQVNGNQINDSTATFDNFDHTAWIVKLIYKDFTSIQNINDFVDKYDIVKDKIYIMPECKNKTQQLSIIKEVVEFCINTGYNLSPRLQQFME